MTLRAIQILKRYSGAEGFRVIEKTVFAVGAPLTISGKELRVISPQRAKQLLEVKIAREWDPKGEKLVDVKPDTDRYPSHAGYPPKASVKAKPQTQSRTMVKRRASEAPQEPRPLTLNAGGRTGEDNAQSSSQAAPVLSSSTLPQRTRGTRRPAGSRSITVGKSRSGQTPSTDATGPGGDSKKGAPTSKA